MSRCNTERLKATFGRFSGHLPVYVVGAIPLLILPFFILLSLVATPFGLVFLLMLPPYVYGLAVLCTETDPEKVSFSCLAAAFSSARTFLRSLLFFTVAGAIAALLRVFYLLFETAPIGLSFSETLLSSVGEYAVAFSIVALVFLLAEMMAGALVRYVRHPDMSVLESFFEEIGHDISRFRKSPLSTVSSAALIGYAMLAAVLSAGLLIPLAAPLIFIYLSENRLPENGLSEDRLPENGAAGPLPSDVE